MKKKGKKPAWSKSQILDYLRLIDAEPLCYILKGKKAVPCDDFKAWLCWFSLNMRSMIVAQTKVGSYRISTVFLGRDHNLFPPGRPILFETMVFADTARNPWADRYPRRYSTWREAEAGHKIAVKEVHAKLVRKFGSGVAVTKIRPVPEAAHKAPRRRRRTGATA